MGWTPDFFDNIEAPPPPQELSAPSHLVEILDPADEQTTRALLPFIPHGSHPMSMSVKRSTVPDGYERAIDHFEFNLAGSGMTYDQGDSLGLYPTNPKSQVDKVLAAMNLTGDEVLRIRPVDSNRSVPLPEVVSVQTLFREILDIAGWPKRRFYEMLKLSVQDPTEKAELEHLCSKEGKADLQGYTAESFTFAELLEKFPSAKPSIGHLLDYVPDIKPRLYSIA